MEGREIGMSLSPVSNMLHDSVRLLTGDTRTDVFTDEEIEITARVVSARNEAAFSFCVAALLLWSRGYTALGDRMAAMSGNDADALKQLIAEAEKQR
jgi:hypothetical protein